LIVRSLSIVVACSLVAGAAGAATLTASSGVLVSQRGRMTDRVGPAIDLQITFDLGALGDCQQPFGINITGGDNRFGDVRRAVGEIAGVRVTPDADNNPAASTANISCYLSVGRGIDSRNGILYEDGFLPIEVDPLVLFSYLGFFWGSPDPYNEISFWDSVTGGNVIPITGFGNEVTGSELTTAFGLAPFQSTYVHFDFGPAEVVRRVELRSIGSTAFEADNLALKLRPAGGGIMPGDIGAPTLLASTAAVPAPAGLALLLPALAAVALRRSPRRR